MLKLVNNKEKIKNDKSKIENYNIFNRTFIDILQ